jgi:hypothetical protein
MFRHEAIMFGQVAGFDRQIVPIHRFRTHGGAEKIDEGLRLLFGRESTEAVFGHAGRGVPEGELDRAPLIDPE